MKEKNHKDIWYVAGVPREGAKLYESLNRGFSYQVYNRLSTLSGLTKKEISRIASISPATLRRRAKTGKFSKDESDRLYRFLKVLDAATDFYGGDREIAIRWLTGPVRGLGYRKPVDMLGTSAETDSVIKLIERLEWGVIV